MTVQATERAMPPRMGFGAEGVGVHAAAQHYRSKMSGPCPPPTHTPRHTHKHASRTGRLVLQPGARAPIAAIWALGTTHSSSFTHRNPPPRQPAGRTAGDETPPPPPRHCAGCPSTAQPSAGLASLPAEQWRELGGHRMHHMLSLRKRRRAEAWSRGGRRPRRIDDNCTGRRPLWCNAKGHAGLDT